MLLAICANVGSSISVVTMDAYLLFLAKDSRQVAELQSQLEANQDAGDSDLARHVFILLIKGDFSFFMFRVDLQPMSTDIPSAER